MTTHDAMNPLRAQRFIGALLAAGGMLIAGPAGVAFADDPHTDSDHLPPGVNDSPGDGSSSRGIGAGGVPGVIQSNGNGANPSAFSVYGGPNDPQNSPFPGPRSDWTPGQIVINFTPADPHTGCDTAGCATGGGGAGG
jgi:hypothetical protein